MSDVAIILRMQRELRYPEWYRHELYSRFAQKIRKSESFVLTGLPGSGRTAAMRVFSFNPQIQKVHFDDRNVLIIYIDTHGLGTIEDIDYYRLIYDELAERLGSNPLTPTEMAYSHAIIKGIVRLLKQAEAEYERVVFICNRVFVLGETIPRVIQQLRAIRDSMKDFVIFIPILEHSDQDVNIRSESLFHPLTTDVVYMPLLSVEEMEKTLLLYQEFYSLVVDANVVIQIANLSGGHPGLSIRLLRLFSNDPTTCDWEHERMLKHPSLYREIRRLWEYLTDDEKDVLVRLSSASDEKVTNSLSPLLSQTGLVHSGKEITIPLLLTYLHEFDTNNADSQLEIVGGRVFVDSTELNGLSMTEFKMLEYFISHRGDVVTRDEIAALISPQSVGDGVSNESIDQYISRIRRKLGKVTHKPLIKTVFGRGYLL